MNEEAVLEKVNEIFQNVFDDDDLLITPETSAEDIDDWDSLAQITIITMIESKFGFHFATSEIEDMKNVGDMITIIMERGN